MQKTTAFLLIVALIGVVVYLRQGPVATAEHLPPMKPVVEAPVASPIVPATTGSPAPTTTPTVVPKMDPVCPKAKHIALIGDSYGECVEPHLERYLRSCITRFTADTRRGTSATQWANDKYGWLEQVLLIAKPDVVVISLGGNDFQLGDKPGLQKAVDKILARIRGTGARALWIEPLSLPYRDLVGAREMWRTAVGDDWFKSEHLRYSRAKDRVHISYDNCRDWTKRVWPWLVRVTHTD